MILITLGTQDKPFTRLLAKIEEQIEKGNIKQEVVVQAGVTKFDSKYMKIFDLVDREKFQDLITKCDLLITHGGVGSILTGLKNNKKVIACPRLAKYKEHMNDHQIQIVEKFSASGYIISYNEEDNLGEVLKKIEHFTPKKYISNTKNIITLIEKYIDESK